MTRHSHFLTHTQAVLLTTLTTTVTHLYCPDHNNSNHNLAKERSETPLIELKSVLSGFIARRSVVLLPTAAAEPKGSYNSATTTTTTILPRVVAVINMKVAAMIWEFVGPSLKNRPSVPLAVQWMKDVHVLPCCWRTQLLFHIVSQLVSLNTYALPA